MQVTSNPPPLFKAGVALGKKVRVGVLTAGGIAPCLSSSIASLITSLRNSGRDFDLRLYHYGFAGLLTDKSTLLSAADLKTFDETVFHEYGGSPIGSSRVKLSNPADCAAQGLVQQGGDPLQIASFRLKFDGIDVLFVVGGDDTQLQAGELHRFLVAGCKGSEGSKGPIIPPVIVGLPKTIDNDIHPIRTSLGALTAADEGARFFNNVCAESTSNPRMLIIHEVMGRGSGYLTAATAFAYRTKFLSKKPSFASGPFKTLRAKHDVHAVLIPEIGVDYEKLYERLSRVMDEYGCVNVFLSEGAGLQAMEQMITSEAEHDAFGHIKLDKLHIGRLFAEKLAPKIRAEKFNAVKSGYFARSARAGEADLTMIQQFAALAVAESLEGRSGCIGHDDETNGELRCIEFGSIRGDKKFNQRCSWFVGMMKDVENYGRVASSELGIASVPLSVAINPFTRVLAPALKGDLSAKVGGVRAEPATTAEPKIKVAVDPPGATAYAAAAASAAHTLSGDAVLQSNDPTSSNVVPISETLSKPKSGSSKSQWGATCDAATSPSRAGEITLDVTAMGTAGGYDSVEAPVLTQGGVVLALPAAAAVGSSVLTRSAAAGKSKRGDAPAHLPKGSQGLTQRDLNVAQPPIDNRMPLGKPVVDATKRKRDDNANAGAAGDAEQQKHKKDEGVLGGKK